MGAPLSAVALLISIYFPPEPGGGSTHGWNRASVLHKMGYSVFVICGFPTYPTGKVSDPKYRGKFFYIENFESLVLIRLRLLSLPHKGYLRRLVIFLNFIFLAILYLPKILRVTGKISIVYSLAPILFSSIIGWAYSKVTRSFFVYESPDLWPDELVTVKSLLTPLMMFVGKGAAKISYKVPDLIITISSYAVDIINSKYKPKAAVYGIPIGVDPTKFERKSKEDARHELIDKDIFPRNLHDAFIVLYSGIISSAQQVENLAYATLKLNNEKQIAVVIVGDGEAKQKLVNFQAENSPDNLYLIPFQPRDIIPTIISASDVCTVLLAPDPIFDIAVPTKFYEYLACGKPIIGICKGELARIIDSNHIGYSVNPGDTDRLVDVIKELKNSPDSLRVIIHNSYSTLEKFSLDSIATIFKDILKKETNNKHP